MKNDEIKQTIIKSFNENINSHAFLFVTNNLVNAFSFVKDIIKTVNCKNHISLNCDCQSCRLIDSNNNPDVINIIPDGKEYKTYQIEELTDIFKTKALINKYKMYIINEADRLGTSCSNKLLKFIEEPEQNIVGFFITNNIQGVLSTIQSRCEIFYLNFDVLNILDELDISEEDYANFYNKALNLIFLMNDSAKYNLMIESKKLSNLDREDMIKLIKIIKNMYIIKYQVCAEKREEVEYIKPILDNILCEDIKILVKRIKILDNILNDLNYNVNKELIFNKLFLMWE